MSTIESRRDFLKKSSMLLGGAAVFGSTAMFTGCAKKADQEVPAYPYPYAELDMDAVEQTAYEGYFENGCCYGVAKGLLAELQDKVGYPYNMIIPEMFANGKEGYTCGTLCGGLSGDVARKTVELLNIHFGYAEAPPTEPATETPVAANEYIGEAEGYGGPIKVKATMDGDKITKIDVLSHGETAAVSDPAFTQIPEAIIKAQSVTVDAAAGATYSSNGIMAAVADALSKVK